MHRATYFRLAGIILLVLAIGGCERRGLLVEQQLLEFGTIIRITMIASGPRQAERLLAEIEERLRNYRGQWHAWEDSDLTRFNQALRESGQAPVPPSLRPLLRLSRDYHDASGGLFNPALGKLIAAYGFHGAEADAEAIAEIRRDLPGMHQIRLDAERATRSNPHLQIDFGGIAKGYAVGLIGDYLERSGIEHYIVNAGGDMLVSGNRFGRPWRIGIQNPFAPGVIARIELEGRHSLFTSGNYLRQYRRGGERVHHILDPGTGEPSLGQSSATVLTADPVRADVAATVLMIDGMRKHRDLALSLGIEDYLLVGESRELLVSGSLAGKLQIDAEWPIKIVN